MKRACRRCTAALVTGASMLMGLVGPVSALDPGVGVGAPGMGVRDPGLNQPGRAGNVGVGTPGVGVGAPGIGVVDPGLNQPGVAGNVGGVARRSVRR